MPERDRLSRRAVEHAQPVGDRAQPKPAGRILGYGRYRLTGEIVRPVPVTVVADEVPPIRIEPAEAAVLRSDPERPLAVFEEGPDTVAAEAARIVGPGLEMEDLPGGGIDLEQTGFERADPDRAVPVGENVPHGRRARAERRPPGRARRRIEPEEAARTGPDPEAPLPVLLDGHDDVVGQAVGDFGSEVERGVRLGFTGELEKSPSGRPDPDRPGPRDRDGIDPARSRGAARLPGKREELEPVAVVADEPGARAEPEKPLRVLRDAGEADGRGPVEIGLKALEAEETSGE